MTTEEKPIPVPGVACGVAPWSHKSAPAKWEHEVFDKHGIKSESFQTNLAPKFLKSTADAGAKHLENLRRTTAGLEGQLAQYVPEVRVEKATPELSAHLTGLNNDLAKAVREADESVRYVDTLYQAATTEPKPESDMQALARQMRDQEIRKSLHAIKKEDRFEAISKATVESGRLDYLSAISGSPFPIPGLEGELIGELRKQTAEKFYPSLPQRRADCEEIAEQTRNLAHAVMTKAGQGIPEEWRSSLTVLENHAYLQGEEI